MTADNKFHGDFSTLTDEEKDLVINPKHYKILGVEVMQLFLYKGMEYMDIMRYALSRHTGVIAHVLGQVFKYSFRLGGKDDELQDATKIAWYGNRLVEEIEFKRGIRKEEPRGDFPEGLLSDRQRVISHLEEAGRLLDRHDEVRSPDLDDAFAFIQKANSKMGDFVGDF